MFIWDGCQMVSQVKNVDIQGLLQAHLYPDIIIEIINLYKMGYTYELSDKNL